MRFHQSLYMKNSNEIKKNDFLVQIFMHTLSGSDEPEHEYMDESEVKAKRTLHDTFMTL